MLHFLFALVTIFVTPAISQNVETYRLPNNTSPESYDISLRTRIHEANFTFTGSVRIAIVVVESTNYIRLHHNVQRLESVRVLSDDLLPVTIGTYSYNRTLTFLTIPIVGSNLTEGSRYFIDIDYVGAMNVYSGFYRSFYNVNGTQRWFASTLLQATYARSAFPCYDEPARKANFKIRITHDPSYLAISNMPAIGESSNSDGSVTTEFESTPRMSTYLVAFHVSDFDYMTSSPNRSIQQRMFSRSTAINSTKLAFEAGELLFDALTDYIGIEYSLPKLDHVTINNFPTSGAKENWGLITSYEFSALFDESANYYTRSKEVVLTISHAIANSWFGNLVTPRWWTYLWMKAGFATFFEYLGVDLVYPEWQMMDYFFVDITQYMFVADSFENARPMTYYVENPTFIESQFSRVAYSKAGSVLRMFWYMFGETTLMRALTSYLQDNAYSDVGEEEFFDALDASVRLDASILIPPTVNVSTILATWTRQAGLPLITVVRNYDNSTDQVTLRQERYYGTPPMIRRNTTWWIPYNLATPSKPGFEETRVEGWIPQNSTSWEINVESLTADDYLLINKRAAGYYRVMYDERNYRLISDAILRNASLFHSTNVAQLLDDAFEFYISDRLTLTPVLDLLRVLEFNKNFISWSSSFYAIDYINQRIRGHRNYAIWVDFVRSLTEELYDSVRVEDIPGEPILQKYARTSIVELACKMGSVHCRSDATRQLRRQIETGEEFHQNIRQVLMCASIRSASRSDFFSVWNRLRSLSIYESLLRGEIIDWLGCSSSPVLLKEFLSSSIYSTNRHNFEYVFFEQYSIIDSIFRNSGPIGVDVALEFFVEHAVEAVFAYDTWFIQRLSSMVSSPKQIELYLVFQNILRDAGFLSQEEIDFNMQNVANSVRWLETEGEVISTWLMENFV